MMDAETKRQALVRLRRIAGQVQGIHRMVEDGKDCGDVLLQISFLGREIAAGIDIYSLRTDFSSQSSFENQSTGMGLRTSFPV